MMSLISFQQTVISTILTSTLQAGETQGLQPAAQLLINATSDSARLGSVNALTSQFQRMMQAAPIGTQPYGTAGYASSVWWQQ